MAGYRAPLRDMRFVLYELHGLQSLQALPVGEEIIPEVVDSILDHAAKLTEEVLYPLNRSGDEEGCRFENGHVYTPKGFPEAYRSYAGGGWISLACDPKYGGQAVPIAVRTLVEEMTCSANLPFASYTNLIQGAYTALHANASEDLKRIYIPRLVQGTWAATMCLTEAQSGSDLNLVRTMATPSGDGTHRITGSKIFISAGDHDLTENIVHLVLARLPDAPEGTKGISLFLVPKLLQDGDGRATVRNGVHCLSIESKMGLKASATCALNFDDAVGWLVGEPHRGLRATFAMMNAARLGASTQGLGIAEASYQRAASYARLRLQGRFPSGAKYPKKMADPIIVHPDVRRMLLSMRAYVEGMRALAQWVAQCIDIRERHPDSASRKEADEFVSLMTPIVKALFTDLGSECANLGVQVLGGAGYIRDHGMEQYIRDVRATQIYDGTNGIQALDLVGRKLGRDRLASRFFEPARSFVRSRAAEADMAEFLQPFEKALDLLERTTAWVERATASQPDRAACVAGDYLRLFGLVALGFMWARMAALALPRLNGPDGTFYRAKVGTARFYLHRILPHSAALVDVIRSTDDSLLDFDDDAF